MVQRTWHLKYTCLLEYLVGASMVHKWQYTLIDILQFFDNLHFTQGNVNGYK